MLRLMAKNNQCTTIVVHKLNADKIRVGWRGPRSPLLG